MGDMLDRIQGTMTKRPAEVAAASALYRSWCVGPQVRRIGMGIEHAVAHRLSFGRTPEQAAAREYLYRWSIALNSRVFGAPHALGM
jgi:hypothetical protein